MQMDAQTRCFGEESHVHSLRFVKERIIDFILFIPCIFTVIYNI
jgi:hypothetical protein